MPSRERPDASPSHESRERVKIYGFKARRDALRKEIERKKEAGREKVAEKKDLKARRKEMRRYEKAKDKPDMSYRSGFESHRGEADTVTSSVNWTAVGDEKDRIRPYAKNGREVWIKSPKPDWQKVVEREAFTPEKEEIYAFNDKVQKALTAIGGDSQGVVIERENESAGNGRYAINWFNETGDVQQARIVDLDSSYVLIGETRDKNRTFDSLEGLFKSIMEA